MCLAVGDNIGPLDDECPLPEFDEVRAPVELYAVAEAEAVDGVPVAEECDDPDEGGFDPCKGTAALEGDVFTDGLEDAFPPTVGAMVATEGTNECVDDEGDAEVVVDVEECEYDDCP
jgi:hypothetical protein